MQVRVGFWLFYLFIFVTYINYQSNEHLWPFKKSSWKDQILPNVIPQGCQVFTPSLALVPASGLTMMDIFDSLFSQVGSDTLIKSSSITGPVAVEGLMKDIFTYLPSSQVSSDMLAKPTDIMQIDNDQHVACSPPLLSFNQQPCKQTKVLCS